MTPSKPAVTELRERLRDAANNSSITGQPEHTLYWKAAAALAALDLLEAEKGRARKDALKEAARVAEAHRAGEQLIRHKMSQVDQVGVVAMTIAKAIRALAAGERT